MAIIKMKPPRCGKMIGLSYLLNYIMNDAKTDEKLIFAQNCNADSAYSEMVLTKEQWNKNNGRQYCHIIQSFDPKENISAETAHEIGKRLMQEFPQFEGFEIVMATHKDKHHLHNHYAINSVNSVTGYKWEQRARDLYALKECSNKLCAEYGLPQINLGTNKENKSYGEWRNRKSNSSWKQRLERDIRICLNNCVSREEFFHAMNSYGYSVTWTNERKYVTFKIPNGEKCRNIKLSNPEYFSKENMQGILDRNYRKNTKLYFAPHQEHFIKFLADTFGQDVSIPAFVNAPCFEGLSNVEIEILMAKYIWAIEETSADKEYMQAEANRKQELDTFLNVLDELLEIYCEYNFENPEEEIPQYENDDDEEDYEL